MKPTKEQLEALIEQENEVIAGATARLRDYRVQLKRLEFGFEEGDVIRYKDRGRIVTAMVANFDDYFPKVYRATKDGFSKAEVYCYEPDQVEVIKRNKPQGEKQT